MNEKSLNTMKRKLDGNEPIGQPSTSSHHRVNTIDLTVAKKKRNGNLTQQIEDAHPGRYSESLRKLNAQVKSMDEDKKNKAIAEALCKMGKKKINIISSHQNSINTTDNVILFTDTSDNDSVVNSNTSMKNDDSESMIAIGTSITDVGGNNNLVNVENVGQYNVDYNIEDVEDLSETVNVDGMIIYSEEDAVVSPMEEAIVSQVEKKVVSPIDKETVSPVEKVIVCEVQKEVVSPAEKVIIPPMQKETVSEVQKEVLSPMDKEAVSAVEKEVASAEGAIVCSVEKQQKKSECLEPAMPDEYGEVVYPEEVILNPQESVFVLPEDPKDDETRMIPTFDFENMLTVKEEIPDDTDLWPPTLNNIMVGQTSNDTREPVEKDWSSYFVSSPNNSESPLPASKNYGDVLKAVIKLAKTTEEKKNKAPKKRRQRNIKSKASTTMNSNQKSPPSSSSATQSASSSSGSPSANRHQDLEEEINSEPSCIIMGESNTNDEHVVNDIGGEITKTSQQQRHGKASAVKHPLPTPRFNSDEPRYYYFDEWLLNRDLTTHDRKLQPSHPIDADKELILLRCFVDFPYPTCEQVQTLANELGVNRQAVRDWFTRKRVTNGISWSEAEVAYARSHLYKRSKKKKAENRIEEPKRTAAVEVNKDQRAATSKASLPQQGNKPDVPVRTISIETNPSPPSSHQQPQQRNIVQESSNVILPPQQQQSVRQSSGSTYHYQPTSNPPPGRMPPIIIPEQQQTQQQSFPPNYQINNQQVQSTPHWAANNNGGGGFGRPPNYSSSNLKTLLQPSNPPPQQPQYSAASATGVITYMNQPAALPLNSSQLQQQQQQVIQQQQQQPQSANSLIYRLAADQQVGMQQTASSHLNQIMRQQLPPLHQNNIQQPTLSAPPTNNNQFMQINQQIQPTPYAASSNNNQHRNNPTSAQDPNSTDSGALFIYRFPENRGQQQQLKFNGAQQQQQVGENGQFVHHINTNSQRPSDAMAKKKFVGKKIDSHFLQYWSDGLGCNLLCSCNYTHSIDVDKYCMIVNLALQPFNTYQNAKPELEKCSYRPNETILPPCCVQSLFYIVRMRLLPKERQGIQTTWSMESEQFDPGHPDWSSFANGQLIQLNQYFINCPYPSFPGFNVIVRKTRVSRNFIQTYFYTIRRHIKMVVENQYGDGDKYGHIYSSMDLWKSKKGDCDKVHTFCMRVVFGDVDAKKPDYFRKAFEK